VKKLHLFCLASLLSVGILPRAAHAQEWTRQSFFLPHGGFELTGDPARPEFMNINMSKNSEFKPVNFPIDLLWGVTDDVLLGIAHETGPKFNTGQSGSKISKFYNDIGFRSYFFLAGGRNYEVALDTGIPLHQLDPNIWVGARIGVLGRANVAETVALVYDPTLYFGFNHRDDGNGDGISVPFFVYFQPTPTISPYVGTGVNGPLKHFGDYFGIPLEGGVLFNVGQGVNIGGMLRFPNALGKNNTLDWRELGFLAQFRF